MLASPLPPTFLETYNLSTSSLGYKDLCIVISFLVLWFIMLSLLLLLLLLLFTRFRVFQTGVCGWFLIEFWVAVSLLKSTGIFSLFGPIFKMLMSRWSQLVFLFLSLLVLLSILWGFFQVHQLLLVSPLPSFSIVFFSSLAKSTHLSPFTLVFISTPYSAGTAKRSIRQVLFLCLGRVVWPRLGDPFIFQNTRELCESHSPGRILGCGYTTCSYGQIMVLIPVNYFPRTDVSSLILF